MHQQQRLALEPPVDIHGMGDHEALPANGSASAIARTYMRGGGIGSSGSSCFDIFAGLWVYMYERAVPHAQREVGCRAPPDRMLPFHNTSPFLTPSAVQVQQNFLLDELQACTVRLRTRRDGIHERMVQGAHEARRARSRGDAKALRARMIGVRR